MFYPLYADYEAKEKPIIKIFGRNEKGEKVVFEDENFEPYFYAIPEPVSYTHLTLPTTERV